MTDFVLSDCTVYKGFLGDLKVMDVVFPSTCDTGDTLDLGSDSAGGAINTILNTLIQDDAGADTTSTWDPATGIITVGTCAAAGIHNLLIIGL